MSSLEDLRYQSIKDALLLLAAREDLKIKQEALSKTYDSVTVNLALHADVKGYEGILWYIYNEIAIDQAIADLEPKSKNKMEISGSLKAKAAYLQVLTTRKSLPVREATELLFETVGSSE